ncbi:MAG: BamA/OMP85 family outer membrane protein [Gemmatimonadota bacterium]
MGLGWATLLALGAAGCIGQTRGAELYPEVAEHQNLEIDAIRFVGAEPFSEDTLRTLIDSEASHCDLLGLPICIPFLNLTQDVHRVNVEVVRRDVARLAAFYRREGYFGTRVLPRAEPEDADRNEVVLTFVVRRGDPITLDSMSIEGTDGIFAPDSMARALPLQAGEQFDLGEFDAAADLLLRELQARGYAYAEVLRSYSVDTLTDRATATLTAVPRLQARVDSVIVLGAEHLGRREAARQLTFSRGDPLRLSTLVESQSNLYALPIVHLASVSIAPDSLQLTPADSATTTVLVSIAEAPVNQAEAAVGYGTVECFRTEGEYTNRSFTGGARTLNVQTSLSKIGLGGATGSGLGRSLCQAFEADTFENRLDYRANVQFTQPFFISPRNHLTINLYAERVSEPDVFQRQANGGRLTVEHRLSFGSVLSASLETQRATTIASPVLFCSAFQVCLPSDLERMSRPRLRNTIGTNYVLDRTDNLLNPSRGHVLRSGLAWAAPWLGSTLTFVRWTGEGALYRVVAPGWVFATSVRLGNFFQTASLNPDRTEADFLPPEERFYAGGATTVRGFSPNALGRGVYVTDDTARDGRFVPSGGTSLGVVNAEVRFPAPLFSRVLRLAAFVDAGAVGTGHIWSLDAHDWRYTPGIGLRIRTPVGPARVDLAYNPYDPVHSVLFLAHPDSTSITPIRDDYAPPAPSFFGRLRVHVAIGQAF